jgi:NRPS condensation-like uncharacterized protein
MGVSIVSRVPFNVVDQWVFHLDQEPEPWSVHCEVRVPGRLDGDRIAAAALAATGRHPMARARMAGFRRRDRRYYWEITGAVDHLPLEILDCPDDAGLADARDRLESMHVNLDSSPPFALTLAHRPGGDTLILNLHHAAADGIGAYRLVTSIARAYAGHDDPVPGVDPLTVRDLRVHAGARSLRDTALRAGELRDRLSQGAAARIAAQGGLGGATGYRFQLLRLGREETEAVMAQRREPATVNDLLVAALAVAIRRFNSQHRLPTGRVRVKVPVNLRPDAWSEEVLANILSFVSVSVPEGEQTDLATAQLAVAARMRELKEPRLSGMMIDLLRLSGVAPVGVRHFLARTVRGPIAPKVADTVILSNLGKFPAPLDFGEGAGAATELWFSPPAQMPLGVAIGAASLHDELFLTLRYSPRQFDHRGAAAFAATWREVLLGG